MKRSLVFAAVGLLLAAPRALGGPGEVTAVSVLPGPGSVNVVIDVRGGVQVTDFTLKEPARLVIDVKGATLRTRGILYDRVNRGGILNIRYSQFTPDIVRVVLELESLRDYRLEHADDAVRIVFGTDRGFTAWSSVAPAALGVAPRFEPPVAERPASTPAAPLPAAAAAPVRPALPAQGSQQPVITTTLDSVSIDDLAAQFASFSGKSIVPGKEITDRFTAHITNQPWDVALNAILASHGLAALEEPPGIITIQSRTALAARDSLEPLRTVLRPVNYARASSLVGSVKGIVSKRGTVVADTASNSLIIQDVESRVAIDSAFVSQLDIQTPQVAIQAKLIFVNRTDIENLGVRYDLGTQRQFFNKLVQRPDPSTAEPVDTDGDGVPDQLRAKENFDANQNVIDLGGNALSALANADQQIATPALRLIFATALGNFNLTSFVEALQQVDLADLQAEPLISASDNSEARIQVGENTPVRQIDVGTGNQQAKATTTFVPTGIILRVTPHVTNNGKVLMTLHAENSSLRAAPADVGFTFQTQQSDNQLLVNDGETAVIGGLTVTEVTVSKSGIPFLVDLPIIGRIFGFSSRNESRRDLLILVTPHIINNPATEGQ
ncbi:MAG: AMIN domain-containing protein [Gemmatimonadetes bacterium]|nr:AMIN domain-containing protein [Gemmatimonadota bacterium]